MLETFRLSVKKPFGNILNLHVRMYPNACMSASTVLLQYSPLLHFIQCCFQLYFISVPPLLLESTLPPTTGSLHVFNHEPTGQAERGKTFYIFNVVQPTEADNIFSNGVPNIALRNQREVYIINDVEVTDAVSLVIQYFMQMGGDAVILGSLTTDITVIGEPKHLNGIAHVASPGRMLAVLDKTRLVLVHTFVHTVRT